MKLGGRGFALRNRLSYSWLTLLLKIEPLRGLFGRHGLNHSHQELSFFFTPRRTHTLPGQSKGDIMIRSIVYTLGLLTALLLSSVVGYAQSASTATIIGTVGDPKGAVVKDATVVAKNVDTGIERTTTTSSDGLYRFDSLPPGNYDVRVDSAGFASAKAENVKLQVGERRDINFSLQVGSATGQVTITSEMPLVETTKTDVSTVVTDRQVATLPTTTSFNGIG